MGLAGSEFPLGLIAKSARNPDFIAFRVVLGGELPRLTINLETVSTAPMVEGEIKRFKAVLLLLSWHSSMTRNWPHSAKMVLAGELKIREASTMEAMKMKVEKLTERDGWIVAQARATARHAELQLQVRFEPPSEATHSELRQIARDEVLRYLDPA